MSNKLIDEPHPNRDPRQQMLLMSQLIVVFMKRCGGQTSVTKDEFDAARDYQFKMAVHDGRFHCKIEKLPGQAPPIQPGPSQTSQGGILGTIPGPGDMN